MYCSNAVVGARVRLVKDAVQRWRGWVQLCWWRKLIQYVHCKHG